MKNKTILEMIAALVTLPIALIFWSAVKPKKKRDKDSREDINDE